MELSGHGCGDLGGASDMGDICASSGSSFDENTSGVDSARHGILLGGLLVAGDTADDDFPSNEMPLATLLT